MQPLFQDVLDVGMLQYLTIPAAQVQSPRKELYKPILPQVSQHYDCHTVPVQCIVYAGCADLHSCVRS